MASSCSGSAVSSARRQFRSLSVASSDPLSPYFTHCKPRQLNKSPSVVGIPHYDADGYATHTSSRPTRDPNPENERKQNSKSADIPGLNLTLSPNDPKASTIRQHYYPEGGWGWVVLVCALIVHILASALHLSVGFFILDIRQQFLKGQESIEAVILGALSTSVSLFLSPVVVALCRRKSIRLMSILGCLVTALGCLFSSFATQLHQLYLSYGLFVGCGDCLARETSTIMVGQYFKKKRETVEMIILMGKGVGFATMPLLVKHWIRSLGWRRGLQLLAGVQCLSCLLGVFFRPASLYHPQRRAILHIKSLQKRSKAKDKMPTLEKHAFFDFSVLKSRTVQVINVGTAITAFGVTSPIVLLMHEAQDEELSNSSMFQLQIILGLAVIIGTAAFGLVVIKNSIQCMIAKQYLCQAASLLISGWLLAFPTLNGFHGYVLFVSVYGIFYGGYFYSLKLCVFEKVRARNFARAWGFVQWCQAVPGVIGIPITGYLNRVFNAKSGFYFSSATVFVGSVFLFFIDVHKNQLRKKKKMEDLKQRFSESHLQSTEHSRRPSQETVFDQMLPKSYIDIRKAQELTCISEEVLVDNFLEDYVDDGITSCNKEEKFLMLSEFENNLFKTDGTLEREREFTTGRDDSGLIESCHHCPICFRAKDPNNTIDGTADQSIRPENKIVEVVDEVTTSL